MSAMADMSRAIREQIEAHSSGATLESLPTETLRDYVQIVGAFWLDLRDELQRREGTR
jgi:hypothetical protein